MSEVLAKGPNFVFAREFIQKEHGHGVWQAVMARLPEEVAAVWREAHIEVAGPFAAFKQGVFALADTLNCSEMVETAEMYKYIADRSLNSLYKAFFRFTSPSFVIKNYPRLWDRFFTAGEVDVVCADQNQAIITFTLPETFLDWLSPACLGYSQKAVEMAGGRHFTMRQLERSYLSEREWQVSYKLAWR